MGEGGKGGTNGGRGANGGGGIPRGGGMNGGGREWGHEAGGVCGAWPLPCPPLGSL